MRIVFTNDLPAVTAHVALVDCGGAPLMDLANNFYVFDHHCDNRFPIMSAAGQVYLAILQGLDTTSLEEVYVNHTDADSVLSVWMLMHPHLVREEGVPWAAIEQLSRIDNHGPAAALPGEEFYDFHYALRPERGVEDSFEVFQGMVNKATEAYAADALWIIAEAQAERPGEAYAINPAGGSAYVPTDTPSFQDVYAIDGMGVIFGDRGMVTIGKLPFFPCRSFKDGLIDALNAQELEKVRQDDSRITELSPEQKWGGADSIMGSPRPKGTRLSTETILKVIRNFLAD